MNRKVLLRLHLFATVIAVLTISCFFSFSLIAEILGETNFIRQVKSGILYGLPLLVMAMPVLGLTGTQLAGASQNPWY